jgi:hypothetical protein
MIQFVPQSEHTLSLMETNKLMLHSEIIFGSEPYKTQMQAVDKMGIF